MYKFMDKFIDWLQKLNDDLIEQFRNQPKMQVFNEAVVRQLDELYAFFYELCTLQWLDEAEGVQLDGIGNIVDLSRTDALIWSNLAGLIVPMDDNLYRKYLMFKIFLNTSEGTYADIVRTLKMFWPDTPFYYSEQIDRPATMFFTSAPMSLMTDLRILRIVTRVKAAGVALQFILQAEAQESVVADVAVVSVFAEPIIVDNPDFCGSTKDYDVTGVSIFAESMVIGSPTLGGTSESYDVAAVNIFKEVRVKNEFYRS